MNAKMIIGICLVVFIIAGLIFLKIREKKNKYGKRSGRHQKRCRPKLFKEAICLMTERRLKA